MSTYRRISVPCPCCEKQFDTDFLVSTIWSEDISTDLLRFTMGKMPINYLVHTCPRCGWSGQEADLQPASRKVRDFVKERITPMMGKGRVPPWRKWEWHAKIKETSGEGDFALGAHFLMAAQCARLDRKYDEEKRYRLHSIDHYLKALKTGTVPEEVLYQTTYLVGEQYRRVEDKWKAEKWFQKVLEMDLEHERREFFTDLARQQMNEPRNIIGGEPDELTREEKPSTWLSRLATRLGFGKKRY